MKWFQNKRSQIAKSLPQKSMLILASAPVAFRQPDMAYPYRQDSNFYYLAGFLEPHSLLLLPSGSQDKSILFIADKNPTQEIWEGKLPTAKEVQQKYHFHKVHYLSELETKLPFYLKNKESFLYNKGNSFFNKKLKKFIKNSSSAEKYLAPFRAIKDDFEVSKMKEAIVASKHGHAQVAKNLKPAVNEKKLHGIFIASIMEKSSLREAYTSIIACGDNANTLHYTNNLSICKKGELLLIDAGAEKHHYASDITRVYPVSGRFSKKQKQAYECLLSLQKQLIKKVRPEVYMKELNEEMKKGLTKILLELDILKGSLEKHLEKNSFFKYCPHSVGHLLGLDVHDPNFKDSGPLILKEGMVITIEPGLYFSQKDKKIDSELRGVGLRIEDDILVTKKSFKNLTANIPKEIKAVEELCKS